MQSLSKNYQSVEESKNTFENSPLYLEISYQGKSESPNAGKNPICQLRKKTKHLKENKNIWRASNLNYILNGIQHSKQNSEATGVERRTQCARLLRAQHHQNAFKTMMRCYVREVGQKFRKTCARHAGRVFAATSIPSSQSSKANSKVAGARRRPLHMMIQPISEQHRKPNRGHKLAMQNSK